ncbi:MAG: Ig-like domain-containing protein, partial [bacterium]
NQNAGSDTGLWEAEIDTSLLSLNGSYVVEARAFDLVGNQAEVVSDTFIYDRQAPVIESITAAPGDQSITLDDQSVTSKGLSDVTVEFSDNVSGLNLDVSATGNSEVTLYFVDSSGVTERLPVSETIVGDDTIAIDVKQLPQFNPPVPINGDGDHALRVEAGDNAGNVVGDTINFTVDVEEPQFEEILVNGDPDSSILGSDPVVLSEVDTLLVTLEDTSTNSQDSPKYNGLIDTTATFFTLESAGGDFQQITDTRIINNSSRNPVYEVDLGDSINTNSESFASPWTLTVSTSDLNDNDTDLQQDFNVDIVDPNITSLTAGSVDLFSSDTTVTERLGNITATLSDPSGINFDRSQTSIEITSQTNGDNLTQLIRDNGSDSLVLDLAAAEDTLPRDPADNDTWIVVTKVTDQVGQTIYDTSSFYLQVPIVAPNVTSLEFEEDFSGKSIRGTVDDPENTNKVMIFDEGDTIGSDQPLFDNISVNQTTGEFSVDATQLPDEGFWDVFAVAVNDNGDAGGTSSDTFYLDETPPSRVEIVSPGDGEVFTGDRAQVSVTVNDPITDDDVEARQVSLFLNGGRIKTVSRADTTVYDTDAKRWDFTIDLTTLKDGTYNVQARAADRHFNQTESLSEGISIEVARNNNRVINVSEPSRDTTTIGGNQVSVEFRTQDQNQVTLFVSEDKGAFQELRTKSQFRNISLDRSINTYQVKARGQDEFGNKTDFSKVKTFVRQGRPNLEITSPDDGTSLTGKSVDVTVEVRDNVANKTINDDEPQDEVILQKRVANDTWQVVNRVGPVTGSEGLEFQFTEVGVPLGTDTVAFRAKGFSSGQDETPYTGSITLIRTSIAGIKLDQSGPRSANADAIAAEEGFGVVAFGGQGPSSSNQNTDDPAFDPSNGENLKVVPPQNGSASMKVYTVNGDLVFETSGGQGMPITWNGRDNTGSMVNNGVYIVKVDSGGKIKSFPVMVVK